MKAVSFLIILITAVSSLSGQNIKDSCCQENRAAKEQFRVPAFLLAGSVILYPEPIRHQLQRFFPNTRTHVDDWLRYGPIAEMYALDLAGFKHRNSVPVQTVNLLISQLITGAVIGAMKESIPLKRPSGGMHSYPSGHTGAAFAGAAVLYNEFRETEPLLAYSGFVLASATGILRITNDAHWLPDVMAGAAVGILVSHLVYQMEPIRMLQLLSQKINVTFIREEKMKIICLQVEL